MNTNTSLLYLAVAIDKSSSPLHPNFKCALAKNPKSLLMHNNIRMAAAQAVDAAKGDTRKAIVLTISALKADAQALVTFVKGIATDVAFAAHMDCLSYERQDVDPEQFDEGIDAMSEAHDIDTSDIPAYDRADAQRAASREAYAGGDKPDPVATSIEDAIEAVKAAQAWLTLAFSGMDEEQREYWGVTPFVPLAQEKVPSEIQGEFNYVPVFDFDAYRDLQTRLWKEKRRAVPVDQDVTDQMMAS